MGARYTNSATDAALLAAAENVGKPTHLQREERV